MRLPTALLTLSILGSMAQGQESNPVGNPSRFKPDELCTVEGIVVKATGGEPVRKVSVTLYATGRRGLQYSASTDATGHFVIQRVEPGSYFLNAGGNGYPFQPYGQRVPGGRGKLLTLDAGRHERDIVIRLIPPGVITGTVYDDEGDPAISAQVQALGLRRTRPTGGVAAAQTNDLGEYRLFGLPPGQYYIVATNPNRLLSQGETDDSYLPTFYPSSPDWAQATTVQVRPGDEVRAINLTLTRVHGVRVRGRVVSPAAKKPAHGIYVSLLPRETKLAWAPFGNLGAAVQDEKGTFEIRGVPSGTYSLSANWDEGNRPYSGRVPVDVGSADIEGITLDLSPRIELGGRVRTNPGAKLDFTKLSIYLQPAENMMGGSGPSEMKVDGTFAIHNVSEGKYRLRVAGFPEEFYLRSVRMGDSEVVDTGLEITHSQPPGMLDLELSPDGGRIDGTVLHDQKPVPAAFVVLVPDPPYRSRDEMYSSKLTDALGRFSLLGLPPGNFKLFAWEQFEGLDFRDPEFIGSYERRGTSVLIREKQTQNVQLELIPAEEEPR